MIQFLKNISRISKSTEIKTRLVVAGVEVRLEMEKVREDGEYLMDSILGLMKIVWD